MTGSKPTTDEAIIKLAIQLMRSGRATMAEVAMLAGTSRQLVAYWASREGIDPVATRRSYLEKLWKP